MATVCVDSETTVTGALVEYLRQEFGEIEVIEDDEDALVEITESEWYRSIRSTITPGENMRVYRELHGLTQTAPGGKLVRLPPTEHFKHGERAPANQQSGGEAAGHTI